MVYVKPEVEVISFETEEITNTGVSSNGQGSGSGDL